MRRKEAPQFIRQEFFPNFMKTLMKEFLSWFVSLVKAAHPFLPVVMRMMEKSPVKRIIPIGHPMGAGFETLRPILNPEWAVLTEYNLNDPVVEKGVYVMVNGFHQLGPAEAKELLLRIAWEGNTIVILEGNNDSLRQIIGMTIIVPLTVILTAPFVRPFRITRLLFTWILPILPIVLLIDGSMALFRLYSPDDLRELTDHIQIPGYRWDMGKDDNGRGGKIIYLTGYPETRYDAGSNELRAALRG